jgi:deoxyribose-phosphate aldolase
MAFAAFISVSIEPKLANTVSSIINGVRIASSADFPYSEKSKVTNTLLLSI